MSYSFSLLRLLAEALESVAISLSPCDNDIARVSDPAVYSTVRGAVTRALRHGGADRYASGSRRALFAVAGWRLHGWQRRCVEIRVGTEINGRRRPAMFLPNHFKNTNTHMEAAKRACQSASIVIRLDGSLYISHSVVKKMRVKRAIIGVPLTLWRAKK